jgi:hypothetical protein
MGSILHGNAKTTPKIREEIRDSQESIASLAKRLSLNPKTVMKWRHAGRLEDNLSGAKEPKTVLSKAEQHIICEFRRTTKLSLDDCYISLKDVIATLSRSNLYRCLKRNNLNVLPVEEGVVRQKKKFEEYPIGFVHIDITEVHIDKQKLYLFVAIDRATKYVFVELHERMRIEESVGFLRKLIAHCPFNINKILTDNGAKVHLCTACRAP